MNNTLLEKINKTDFKKLFEQKGYAYFTKGDYNLNIIGIRSNQENKVTNYFDDALVVEYNENGKKVRRRYTITTEPGKKLMLKPINSKGAAILVPGQYRSTYTIDLHKGKYKALCQRLGPVKVYRDNDKDMEYDLNPNTIDKGWFGINIHRADAGWTRQTIDGYSAGCQVFNNPNSFKEFMDICEKAKAIYGNKFTYTLITEDDLA